MKCKKCGTDLGGLHKRVASICLLAQGDEEVRSYFLCKACNVYTVWFVIENFFTDELTRFAADPIPREKGDKIIENIRKCPDPMDKWCTCPTHEELSH